MSELRSRILVAGFVVFGVACGTASNPEMGSIGGVDGSDHGSAATGSGAAGDSTANTGAGGMSESGNAGGATGGSGGSDEVASDSGSVGSGLDSGADAGPGLMLTGKKFVGNISTRGRITTDFNKYWNEFTPENEGKWGQAEPQKGSFNWAPLDAEYQYTQQNNVLFKHHNFIWGAQQPGWVAGLSAADAVSAVQAWMQGVCSRYPNVKLIDVVNEPPPHTTPPYVNLIGGTGASGYDWIVNAFKWARAACPKAILLLNDYNNIEVQGDHDHFISIVKAIKGAGAPIDGVGAQAHGVFRQQAANVQKMIDSLASETGLPVFITEFDINDADDMQQLQAMQSLFTMFWNDANVKGITIWGYIVGSTWEANTGLMTSTGTMRPAMTWLEDFLKTH